MFVRIGTLVINLNNVAYMDDTEYDSRLCISVYFIGQDYPLHVYHSTNPGEHGYETLKTWMKLQDTIPDLEKTTECPF